MPTQAFPELSPAESEAYELLTVWYTRAYQIGEHIRAMEPDDKRRMAVYEQVEKDLEEEPGSIAHIPLGTDVQMRTEHLRRCHELFDGDHHTLYDWALAYCAADYAGMTIIQLSLRSSKHREFIIGGANVRSFQALNNGAPPPAGVPT
eukprot:TRINITY_DN5197_c0_g1_i1.p1 TRINITY_DN5197_c0_g1~~TRINITY_DN5197_c0_g1_i1.p1  ORF type:complete len:148 (-),score=4.43 TRINITY_DN5197_c0_g1_i1:136-579(-)